ncbi:DUF4129 domain-containing protein [Maribellus sediminis]|uniref:DUF4129 domain-containing protein n=1 Tax=Maribellus sediminis TaxID=2696285 RepID=UPI00142F9E8B|nr:DUF4129 domain-containing protein [Maribellus sediminis]
MSRLLPKIVVFIVLFLCLGARGGFAFAADSETGERQFSETKLEEFRADKDFQYDSVTYRQITIWDKVRYYFYQLLKFMFGEEGAAPVIRYVFLVAVILFVVLQLTGAKVQWFLGKGKQAAKGIVSIPDEDISNIDLQELADKALSEGNLRLCIRYHYLHLLKVLDEKAHISWHKDKTNRDYLAEIKEPEIRKQFRQQTLVFDYVWYGNFKLSDEQFAWVNSGFQQLVNKLQSQE